MSAPADCTPSPGPFIVDVNTDPRRREHVRAQGSLVRHSRAGESYLYSPAEARELAAALIECAGHIDRAAMTPAEIADETHLRR